MATKQTASGADKNSPTSPQSVVQDTAAMMIAKDNKHKERARRLNDGV